MSGDSKCLSFCLKKLILRLWAAQNCPPSNQISVTHNTKGFQVWSRHTAPPGGQKVQNVSSLPPFESATLKITSNDGATVKNFCPLDVGHCQKPDETVSQTNHCIAVAILHLFSEKATHCFISQISSVSAERTDVSQRSGPWNFARFAKFSLCLLPSL